MTEKQNLIADPLIPLAESLNPMVVEPAQAAYVHWPFCQRKCGYCDFVSWPPEAGQTDRYLQCLLREIRSVAASSQRWGNPAPLTSVFFGGGTPSLARTDQLVAILEALRQTFGIEADAEITLEANPGTVTRTGLSELRAAGFNRISFGLQAAQDSLLATLGRIHTVADFIKSVQDAKTAGFERISADLMLGLPGQTLQDVDASIDLLLELDLSHVSYYSLIIEPGTPFEHQYGRQPDLLPDDELERLMYHRVRDRLAKAGIKSYEISNAARPGEICRHNQIYWLGLPYYGFGVAAHSYLQGVRRGNTESWRDYLAAWDRPDRDLPLEPFAAADSLTVIDRYEAMNEMMLLGLRLTDGVDWTAFAVRFACDARDVFASELADLVRSDLIALDEAGFRLTPHGLDFANQAFSAFVH